MKSIILFGCEICGVTYENESKCRECEKSHKIPHRISNFRTRPKDEYPDYVTVKFDDGSEKNYYEASN